MVDIETVERGIEIPSRGCVLARAYSGPDGPGPDATLMAGAPEMLAALESVLHQLCTDSDLETVTAAAGYRQLELLVRRAIAKADPSNPQLTGWHDTAE